MASWTVRIGRDIFKVVAGDRASAKLIAARRYVIKYPNANLDTSIVLSRRKVEAHKNIL